MKFIHLHNHSHYSILDGAMNIDRMIEKAIELDMPGIALTDHGNMFGAIEFYQKCKRAGIKPIIGQEFYVAPGSRFKKEFVKDSGEEKSYHLILLAKNLQGYKNLMKLSSIGFLDGFYYKPRIDMETLMEFSEGLICSSACIAGEIQVNILKGKNKEAREIAERFKNMFPKDHFYLEMQDHGLQQQKIVNAELIKISEELHIPLIATNDAHYASKDDAYSHEVLLCIQTGKTMQDEKRMKFGSDEFYLKSEEEMLEVFPDYPDAIYNTYKIYEMIDVELELDNPVLPNFEVPDGFNLETYLRHLVLQGAKRNYGEDYGTEVQERIDYELKVIINMGFPGYFLIVWDFINHAREMKIPVGPGRGSAAGSIVSYCLDITALDPLKYNLLFERFLNPDRNEMPDMDLDFCANRREEVIDYVRDKYGHDKVSQIITFNTMAAKGVLKDVARALDIPYSKANEVSKAIEQSSLKEELEKSKDFQAVYEEEGGKEWVDIALRLEGLARSAGKHAAGVVISPEPLTEYVPLYKDTKEGGITSQYEKNTLEAAGLVKMDFLGLQNLTIIDMCIKLIKKNRDEEIDIDHLPLDDEPTYKLLQDADTKGVFQLESSGMQGILRRLKPTVFEDIIAIVALYRPGPLGSGMTEDFVQRKQDPSLVAYPHEKLEPVLNDTLGVIVYQEQVMLISQVMGGFTLPEADKLRKAMGKKKMDIIDALEEKFLAGAKEGGFDVALAQDLYNSIKKFGEYGFNKSHSAAYALVTYQTAYLKAHYPVEYMTSLLSAQPDKTENVVLYVNDCKDMGIKILPPSINHSDFNFSIEGDVIRYGLGAIKGIGGKAIDSIVAEREKDGAYTSVKDYLERVDMAAVNKGALEALIKSGAFESVETNRASLFISVEMMVESAKRLQQDKKTGQGNLFGGGESSEADHIFQLHNVPDWKDSDKLSSEKEVVGLYLSGHPLEMYAGEIKSISSVSLSSLKDKDNDKDLSIVGIIGNLEIRVSQKSGKKFGIGLFEDLAGAVEILFFPRTLAKFEEIIASSEPVLVTGKVEVEGDRAKKILANDIKPLRDVRRGVVSALHIQIDPVSVDETIMGDVRSILEKYKGGCPVFFHINEKNDSTIVRAHTSFNVTPAEQLVFDLAKHLGESAIKYSIGHSG